MLLNEAFRQLGSSATRLMKAALLLHLEKVVAFTPQLPSTRPLAGEMSKGQPVCRSGRARQVSTSHVGLHFISCKAFGKYYRFVYDILLKRTEFFGGNKRVAQGKEGTRTRSPTTPKNMLSNAHVSRCERSQVEAKHKAAVLLSFKRNHISRCPTPKPHTLISTRDI